VGNFQEESKNLSNESFNDYRTRNSKLKPNDHKRNNKEEGTGSKSSNQLFESNIKLLGNQVGDHIGK
jgi:hypothetical protein